TEASKTVIKTENNFQNFDNQPKDQNDFQNQMQPQPQPQITIEMGSNGEMIQKVTSYSSYSESSNIISQVTDQIKLNISAESTTMEMQLHPATLGAVNLQIASENGVMKAHILVQNETVREVLASQMEQLLKTFEEQGQKVSEIDVSVANYNLENGMSQNMEQEGKQGAPGGKGGRRNINLNELSDLEYQELSEEERLEAEMMNMNGSSVLYRA
nr:flagellar hook-length control protein FliK [Lachnospiraceae bacterium]